MDHRQIGTIRAWIMPGAVLLLAAVIAVAGDAGRDWMRYDRLAIGGGEVWRLVSGHLAHLGWSHFLMNATGLLLIWFLVATHFGLRSWIAITVFVITGIDIGFWFLQPQLTWYVGLSGVLHGLLAAGAIAGLFARHIEAWLIVAFLVAKLIYETRVGPLPGSEGVAGGNVVVAAHLYGALAGFAAGLVICLIMRAHNNKSTERRSI